MDDRVVSGLPSWLAGTAAALDVALLMLAALYADHPGYDRR